MPCEPSEVSTFVDEATSILGLLLVGASQTDACLHRCFFHKKRRAYSRFVATSSSFRDVCDNFTSRASANCLPDRQCDRITNRRHMAVEEEDMGHPVV